MARGSVARVRSASSAVAVPTGVELAAVWPFTAGGEEVECPLEIDSARDGPSDAVLAWGLAVPAVAELFLGDGLGPGRGDLHGRQRALVTALAPRSRGPVDQWAPWCEAATA